MRLPRRIIIQTAIFAVVGLTATAVMLFGYVSLPTLLLGTGRYEVTVELAESGALYPNSNVTYRGTEVGRVKSVQLTDSGAAAVLSLNSDIAIPADLNAEVHSQSAIGEQYIALFPRTGSGPPLKNGDVIAADRTSVPPPIDSLLDATNTGLQAIPRENLRTTIDEAYTAIGGLGPDISRFVKGSTTLAIDARKNLDPLTTLIDQSGPILASQGDTADSIQAWSAHLATIADQLQTHDDALRGVLQKGPAAGQEVRALFDRLQPTLPLVLANLVSIGQVAVTYQPALEQILVLIPQGVAMLQAGVVANHDTKQPYTGQYLSFNLNLNLPPTCSTGFLPVQQQRTATFVDAPDRPAGDLYCRIPQDAPNAVRGARNYPCLTVPGKRAPTEKMCESNENYVPLNDGNNWKGDPNATLSGQDVPQLRSGSPPAAQPGPAVPPPPPPPVAVAQYDPATGTYLGPDGQLYTQSDLSHDATTEKSWQDMLTPSHSN